MGLSRRPAKMTCRLKRTGNQLLDRVGCISLYLLRNTQIQNTDLSHLQICPALHCRLLGSSVPRTQSGRRGGRAGGDLADDDDDDDGDDGDDDDFDNGDD